MRSPSPSSPRILYTIMALDRADPIISFRGCAARGIRVRPAFVFEPQTDHSLLFSYIRISKYLYISRYNMDL